MRWTIGWVEGRASISMALSLSPTAVSRLRHSGWKWSVALAAIQLAKPSLSHRSSHQAMVTRSPDHRWAISWAMTLKMTWRSAPLERRGSKTTLVWLNRIAPQFSIEPETSPGAATRSSLGSGYFRPK